MSLSSSYLSFCSIWCRRLHCSFEFHDTIRSWFSAASLIGLSHFLSQLLFLLLSTKFRFCPCLTLPGQSRPCLWTPHLISAWVILHPDPCPGLQNAFHLPAGRCHRDFLLVSLPEREAERQKAQSLRARTLMQVYLSVSLDWVTY